MAANGGRPQPHRVLVVDDDADAAQSIRELLSFEGYDVHVAESARDGVRVALAVRPHVAVIDLKLQELDGFLLARSIRRELGNSVALVAFSGWSRPEYVQRSIDAGFDEYVVKPDTEKLVRVVRFVAGARSGEGHEAL